MRIGIEAGVRQVEIAGFWGNADAAKTGFIGMDRFGASAPAEVLFEKLASRLARLSKWQTTYCEQKSYKHFRTPPVAGFSFAPLNVCENVNANINFTNILTKIRFFIYPCFKVFKP